MNFGIFPLLVVFVWQCMLIPDAISGKIPDYLDLPD